MDFLQFAPTVRTVAEVVEDKCKRVDNEKARSIHVGHNEVAIIPKSNCNLHTK